MTENRSKNPKRRWLSLSKPAPGLDRLDQRRNLRTDTKPDRSSHPSLSDPTKAISLEVADLGVSVICQEGHVREVLASQYRDFPLQREPDLRLQVMLSEDPLRQSALLDTGMAFDKNGVLHFQASGYRGQIDIQQKTGTLHLASVQPAEEVEYLLRVAFALLAFEAGGLMLHAAGIVRGKQAYLFFGHSGAGKTTIARHSTDADAIVLNDDLVILRPKPSGWQAYGTPFWNPTQTRPSSHDAPLGALFQLVQDRQVFLEPLSPSKAIAELVANVPVIPADPARGLSLLQRISDVVQCTPVQRLHFLPDSSFWNVVLDQ